MDFERIFTETPITSIWNRLDILTTFNGVKEELTRKKSKNGLDVSSDLIDKKAKGVAFCIRSARDLFNQSNINNLTPSLTLLYYGTYNLLSALLIAGLENELTLENIEDFSKNGGHGLKTLYNETVTDLPDNEFIYGCNNGFFPELLKKWGYNKDEIVMPKNLRKISETKDGHSHKLIRLRDLLSRIPEIKNMYIEVFAEHPNYIHYRAEWSSEEKPIKVIISPTRNSEFIKSEQINSILGIPADYTFKLKKERESSTEEDYISDTNIPRKYIGNKPKYNSPIAQSCTIKPLLGIDDVMLFYFLLLYMLSIWTRYRPNLWREVYEGKFDHYRSIFSTFATATERIVPNLFINRFYNRTFLFAGHSYFS